MTGRKRYSGGRREIAPARTREHDTCSAVQRGGSHTGVSLDTPLPFIVKYYLGNNIDFRLSVNETRSAVQRGGSHTGVERQ